MTEKYCDKCGKVLSQYQSKTKIIVVSEKTNFITGFYDLCDQCQTELLALISKWEPKEVKKNERE